MMISNIQETRETKVRELENEARERELDLLMEVIHVKYSELGPTFVE